MKEKVVNAKKSTTKKTDGKTGLTKKGKGSEGTARKEGGRKGTGSEGTKGTGGGTKKKSPRFGYVLDVVSHDHPGIVAALSEGIGRLGGNIESCSQTVLSGYFSLITTVTFEKDWDPDELVADIMTEDGLQGCQIFGSRMTKTEIYRPDDSNIFVLTAFGKDREEIVLSFSRYLADKGVNIIDLYAERPSESEFVLIGQIEVRHQEDIRNLLYDLEEIGNDFGFTVKLQHKNIFVATNQLRLIR